MSVPKNTADTLQDCTAFIDDTLSDVLETLEVALAQRVGELATGAFSDRGGWAGIAATQEHPIIVASHSAAATRPRECRRACGLQRCTGACGRHVGALDTAPEDLYALARDVVQCIERESPGACPQYDPSHCWALVYGTGERCDQMQSHLDRPEGWTLSISVGASAKFTIGCPPEPGSMYDCYGKHLPLAGQQPPGISLELRAGDALLFQGHRVFHSVDGMAPGSGASPAGWREALLAGQKAEDTGAWAPARLALLFRDQNTAP
eukprot:jgi/Tetstr1/447870/TSEL_035180.t1